ncbi:MAG: dynamin family protein [Terracidiphilus sp.]|jgi:GTP-binding protein EngB required for normal cell division
MIKGEENSSAKVDARPEHSPLALSRVTSDADGAARLLRLAHLAEELASNRIAEEANDLAKRIFEGRFYVACIGQFKRGKSTLINALIDEPVLPVGFTPVTAVPTVIRFGDQRRARIQQKNGSWQDISLSDLNQYVSEENNPENTKGIRGVEVFVPSRLLVGGMCFVDTPGLGSVFTGNTAATHAFIPHIDAALVVIGADPPLAGEELALVEAVAQQVQDIVLVLNKADRVTPEEKTAAMNFADRQVRKRLQRDLGPIFEVSAAERVDRRGPERDWQRLVNALDTLVDQSGRRLIYSACERGIDRLSEQLLAVIWEERDALQRPIEESERRIATMKITIAEAERSMRELKYLFMAEQQHISDMFVDRHKHFLAKALPEAKQELEQAIAFLPYALGPRYRRRLMKQAQQIAKRSVIPWLSPEQEEAEQQYRRVSPRFVEIGNNFLKKLAEGGVPELARMPHALDPEAGFRIRSAFTFADFIQIAQPVSPLRWLADVILSCIGALFFIQNDAREFLVTLLETNSTRVQSDILNRIQESHLYLEVEIRKLLHEVSRVAEQALRNARKVQREGSSAVHAERQRMAALERQLVEL